tara:strand:- start:1501 stop:2343 length:843 start_codon:yes stop_codon:yes gene_type:complete
MSGACQNFLSCLIFCILLSSELVGKEKTEEDSKSSILEIKNKLESIAERLDDLKYKAPKLNIPEPSILEISPERQAETSQLPDREMPKIDDKHEPVISSLKHINKSKGVGFYILPFFGMQTTNDLEWNSVGGVFEIEESIGLSGGLRLGYDWRNFFADFQLSYFHNDMKSINVPLVFLGETDGVGFHFSGGGRIHFNDYISGLLGAGLGGVNQESSFLLSGISVEESDFLFSFQLFTGLELRPVDYLVLGIRYRWMRVEEMELFSARDMHLAELSVGYVF